MRIVWQRQSTQSSLKLAKKAPTCVESLYVFIWLSGVKSTFTGGFRAHWFWTAFGRGDCMCRTDFCTEHRIQLRSVCMQHLWRPTVTEPRRFCTRSRPNQRSKHSLTRQTGTNNFFKCLRIKLWKVVLKFNRCNKYEWWRDVWTFQIVLILDINRIFISVH